MIPSLPRTTRHALWLRTGFTSGPATRESSDRASSTTASLAASLTLACASPSFSSSCGASCATPECTSLAPTEGPIWRVAWASSLHDAANTFATLSLNRRPRTTHTARNTSRSFAELTAPLAVSDSILTSAASRCIQFFECRHIATYSPNASTIGAASVARLELIGSGGGRSALNPSGASALRVESLAGVNPVPPPTDPNSSSAPGGKRLRPVAPAGTSSLFPPCALGSELRSRNRWGVEARSPAASCIAALLTAGRSS